MPCPTALAHEQPNPRTEPGHEVAVAAGHAAAPDHRRRRACRSTAPTTRRPSASAPGDRGQRHGAGRRDRGDRGPGAALLPRRAVAPRIRHQPRRHRAGRGLRARRRQAGERRGPGRGRADRQADRARRPVLAPRRRGAGSPRGRVAVDGMVLDTAGRARAARPAGHRRRQAAARGRAAAPVPLPQAARAW